VYVVVLNNVGVETVILPEIGSHTLNTFVPSVYVTVALGLPEMVKLAVPPSHIVVFPLIEAVGSELIVITAVPV
jgi:hypothetical protein